MLVLIKKDESTSVSREVADMAEARALASQGMPVFLQNEDGSTEPVDPHGTDEAPVEYRGDEQVAQPAAAAKKKAAPAKKPATRK